MKRLLLTLSIAIAVAIGAAPLSAHAKSLTTAPAKYSNSFGQSSSNGQWIVRTDDEEDKTEIKNLLEKCKIGMIIIFKNGCLNAPGGSIIIPQPSIPETSEPEETQPIPPTTENTEPDSAIPETSSPESSIPETTIPETQAPAPSIPEISAPETQAPIPSVPETSAPETQAPENSIPEITVPETQAPENSQTVHPYILRIVELVNEERAKAGLKPVTLDTGASTAAQVRAKEIVSSFSHTRPNGSSFTTALKEQGVSYRMAGENIAWGQRTPEQVMEGWMNSSGHRANILKESFTHIGVGYYQANGVNYWTQLFFQ